MSRIVDAETFEDRLLARLKEELPEPEPLPWWRAVLTPRRRVAVAAVLAAVTTVVVLDPGAGPSPAYAVTRNPDGTVTVIARDFIDAERLEGDLRDAGVRADVRDAGGLLQCSRNRLESERKELRHGEPVGKAKVITWWVRRDGLAFRIDASRMRPAERLRIDLDPIRPEDGDVPPEYQRRSPLWLQVKVTLTDRRGVRLEEPYGYAFAKPKGDEAIVVCVLE